MESRGMEALPQSADKAALVAALEANDAEKSA